MHTNFPVILIYNDEQSDFTAGCNSVCSNTTSANDTTCKGTACPIVLLFVVDNEKRLMNTTGKYGLNITCKISTTGNCSKSLFIICVVGLYHFSKLNFSDVILIFRLLYC